MKSIKEIIEENNAILNDNNEVEISFDFANEDEAYDAQFKINQRLNNKFNVSISTSDISYDEENDEIIENSGWIVADFFFSIDGLANEEVEEILNIIQSV